MSRKEQTLTREAVAALLSYDPLSGVIVWKRNGKVAGYKLAQRHIAITIQGVAFYAHRLAWLLMTGDWPAEMIDHLNGVQDDNRWDNLRACSRSVNVQNQRKPSKNNKCGFLGVYYSRGKYRALIQVPGEGRQKHLGCFETPEAAHAAYVAAKRRLHPGNTL